jgi:hypothetical protein
MPHIPSCKTCKLFLHQQGKPSYGTCHALPPQMGPDNFAKWPLVMESAFCAEHHAAPSTKTQRLLNIIALASEAIDPRLKGVTQSF